MWRLQNSYCQLHLCVYTRQKTCSNRVPDKTCFATKHLKLTAVNTNCQAKSKLFLSFDQCIPLIVHYSQLSCIFLAQKQHTCLQKLLFKSKNSKNCSAKENQIDNSCLLQTLNVWWQNVSCLHPIKTCFFLTCTCLDATNSI